MLEINPISLYSPSFQAKTTSVKLAEQKIQRSVQKNLPKVNETKSIAEMIPTTALKSQIITEIGLLNAKLAPKEYATTSAKLAEQKGKKLSTIL